MLATPTRERSHPGRQTVMGVDVDLPDCAVCGHSGHHSDDPEIGCCECHWASPTRRHAFVPVRVGATNPAWEAILRACLEVGRPGAFRSDLFRDWQAIDRRGHATQFVWGLRECGTEIYFPVTAEELAASKAATKGRMEPVAYLAGWIRAAVKTWPDTLWYAWSNGRLRAIPSHRAVEIVAGNFA